MRRSIPTGPDHGPACRRRSASHVAQDRYPDKRVFAITDSGETALDTWLNSSERPPSAIRIPELLKLFFGHRMDGESIRTMLGTSREEHVQSIARFETLIEQFDAVPSARFALATARYGLLEAQMVVTWIDETLETHDADGDQIIGDQIAVDDLDSLDAIRRIPPRRHEVGGASVSSRGPT